MRFIYFIFSVFVVSNLKAQVVFQNGSANYSIPLFSYSDAKTGLGTGVSLNYSSGNGLIVSDRASSTGQNWSVFAGGSITRKQNGEPDDQNSTSIFPTIPNANVRGFNQSIAVYDEDYQSFGWAGDPYSRFYIDNYFPNGFMYSEFPLDMTQTHPLSDNSPRELALLPRFRNSMDKRWKQSRRALTDRQQDVFIYNFNGVSGEFVIGKDGNPLLIGDSKILIEKTTADMTGSAPYPIRTRINSFTIKDPTGLLYKFNAFELSEVMKFVEVSSEGTTSFRKIITSAQPTGKFTIQRWLLTEIVNPATQEKIIFEYEDYSIDLVLEKTPTYQNTVGQSVESVQIFEQRASGKLKRLKNILLPDGHKVQFSYNTALDRVDVPGNHPLSQVQVSYNNEVITTYNLSYGYFLKKQVKNYTDFISESDKRFARLCLISLQKSGVAISEPAYKFSYYNGSESSDPKDIVPPFDCMAQDHWGFYNKASIINIDEPNPTKEVLKDLLVNSATHRQPASGIAKYGLLKSVENPLGGKQIFEYEQNESIDSDNPTQTKLYAGVRVFRSILHDGISTSNDIITTYYYKKSDGSSSGWGFESPTYVDSREIKIWNASTLDGYTKEGVLINDITTGLLRKLLREKMTPGVISEINKQGTLGGGVSMDPSASFIASIILNGLIDRILVLFNPNDYIWSNTYNYFPHQSKNPLGVNYSRVEVVNTSLAGGSGKAVYEFTAPPLNIRSEIPVIALPYSPKQRFAGWKYGLPLKNYVIDQSGVTKKEITYTYSVIQNAISDNNHKSSKVELIRPESASCWAASYNLPITDFSWEFYYPITGRSQLVSTSEKNYGTGGILSEIVATNSYNNDLLTSSTSSYRSNGDLIKIKTYYTNDYNNISTAIQEMKARNMLAVPISTETWLTKPNGNEYLIDATINEFSLLANGEIKIKKIYKLETGQPLLKSLIGEQSPGILVRNSTYFKERLNYNYDNAGTLIETTTPEGRVSSSIYDHNSRYVTASATNAAQAEIAYSSFETTSKGGWLYDNSMTTDGVFTTGRKCYEFSSINTNSPISRVLTGSKSYRLSFWTKGEQPYVITTTQGSLNPDKTVLNSTTGWSYVEYAITAPCTIEIKNANGGTARSFFVDELRLYPKDARMSTVSYNPVFGKITECDVNNRILYYEYDDLGRVKTIKDENRNVVKAYEYNYKN